MQHAPRSDSNQTNIAVAEDIRRACGLTEAEAHFAFDSSRVREQDRIALSQVAHCFAEGPLAGRQVRLVGHADPRGEQSYNLVLGQVRADNVMRAMVGAGMIWNQITTTSRGELDATGVDEDGWARDRRVDVILAE